MSRPKSRNEEPGQRERPGVRVKIYVRDDMIGGGKMDLLKLVARHGAIAPAAREMLSFISVPPRSFAPQFSIRTAILRPSFTQLT